MITEGLKAPQRKGGAAGEDWAPEKRRRALFDIWDECDDGSNCAAMARATITAIIRPAFPEGSASERSTKRRTWS